jgi:hypothetical protein
MLLMMIEVEVSEVECDYCGKKALKVPQTIAIQRSNDGYSYKANDERLPIMQQQRQ